jgi:hypothetical protein
VIATFYGKVTNHVGIRIERVLPQGNGLVVEFREFRFNRGMAPLTTCPCQVVVVDKVDGKVEFKALPIEVPLFQPVP